MSPKKVNADQIEVSVVIPSYNAERFIEKCLDSLYLQKQNFTYEIIVVDSSSDSTPNIILQKFPQVRLIHLDQQTYPGTARNIGVEQSRGEIIAFLDSDCVAQQGWLSKAVEEVRKGHLIVGGGIKNNNPHSMISRADFILTFNEFVVGKPSGKLAFIPTCNFVCTKKVFQEIGGFDPRFSVGEDTLFCYRAAQRYELYFCSEAAVAHTNREKFKAFWRHHYNFGKHSAVLRKKIDLPGKIFARYPLLALFVPAVRMGRIFKRLAKYDRSLLLQGLLVFSLLLVGLTAWSKGFIWEAFKREEGDQLKV